MALSYSGLNNYGKATLPSAESWGTNMNILRDPPKSLTTRRIDKVGDTSNITDMIDSSGGRACEAISHYAYGVNPMVSVSYSSEGNNGGNRSTGLTAGGNTQSYGPHTIMKDGAFRPPVWLPEDLQPLSRMPRVFTSTNSNPRAIDYSKKLYTCGDSNDYKAVRNNILHTNVRPNAVYKMQAPLVEPFEVKYMIQPVLHTSANSGMRTMDHTTQHVMTPYSKILDDNMHVYAQSNVSDNRHVANSEFDTGKYIQNTNHNNIISNPSSSYQVTPIDEVIDTHNLPTKDIRAINYTAPISGMEKNNLDHAQIVLTKTLPQHTANTNISYNIHKQNLNTTDRELSRNTPLTSWSGSQVAPSSANDNNSRDYNLAQKINPGGYTIPSARPQIDKPNQEYSNSYGSKKANMSKMVSSHMQGRYV